MAPDAASRFVYVTFHKARSLYYGVRTLLEYQCALRSDERVRLRTEQSKVRSDHKLPVLELFLPYSKGDRTAAAMSHRALYLVTAWQDWLDTAGGSVSGDRSVGAYQ